jgi:hypothetical protein
VYVWADGVYLQARMEEAAEWMLVLIGATPEGKKELVGFQTGVRENAQSWRELLIDIKQRGLEIAPTGRRFRAIVDTLIDDAGGDQKISAMKLQLFRRSAACAVVAEDIELKMLRGEPYNVAEYMILAGILLKVARLTGVEEFRRMSSRLTII